MANLTVITDGTNIYKVKDTISSYSSNIGTVTKVTAGAGLTGGSITTTGTLACDLKSTAVSTLAAASRTSTSSREYPVGLDKNGDLSVNVPWTNTTYSAGTNISISSNTISVTNIGSAKQCTDSSISVPHNTDKKLVGMTSIPAGVWYIEAECTWSNSNSNQNGYRKLILSHSSIVATAINPQATILTPAYNNNAGDQFIQQLCTIRTFSSSYTEIHLWAYQNSRVAQSTGNVGIYMVRLK